MEVAVVVVRLLLVGVFALAGASKLADLSGSRTAVAGFGVPVRIARVLGTLLPLVELSIAGLLLISSTARVGAIGAVSLLAVFAVGIFASLARGKSPDCHCFGQLHSEPVGPATLVRGLALAAIAAFVALGAEPPVAGTRWAVAELDAAGWLNVAAALVFLALLTGAGAAMLGLLRQNGRLLLRVEALEAALHAKGIPIPQRELSGPTTGLPVGTPAPDFSLPDLQGETVTLASLRARGKPVIIFFTDSGCGPCRELVPRVGEWQRRRADELTMAVLTRRLSTEMRADVAEHGLRAVLVDEDDSVSEAYRARLTPGAVLIDDAGRIAAPLAAGNRAITALVEQARASGRETVPPAAIVPVLREAYLSDNAAGRDRHGS